LPDPLSLRKNQVLSFFNAIKFFSKSDFGKPDFVHCFVEPYALFTLIISFFLKTKYFLTIHGSYGVKGFDSLFYKFFQIFSYKRAKKIICISNYTKNRISEYGAFDNLVVIPNGVNEKLFSFKSDNIEKENSIISVSGLLKNRKGQHITLGALALVKNKISDVKYHIIGGRKDNVYCSLLDDIIKKEKLSANVIFHGNVSDEERNKLYNQSKIFVLNPVSDDFNFEGFGLVYLEANAFGLPVIGSYGNGGEDAIKDGYNGFLVHNNNLAEVAEKINLLLEDDALYVKMSDNAREWIKDFSWDKISQKYISVYEIQE
jgi:phosphatidylinositol alpha-1,6-mannosyltransferase